MKRSIFCVLTIAVVAGISTTGCKKAGLPSKEEEQKLGLQFAKEYDEKLPDGPFITSGPQFDQLTRIANRVLPLARRDWDVPYRVRLVNSKEINAFAVPGGPIYFYKGLMDLAKSDDEIASVMGHEISHVTKRHSMKQMQQSNNIGLGVAVVDVLLGRGNNTIKSAAGALANLQLMKFSRGDETQADEYGFSYLISAGYDPNGMAQMFTRMNEKTGGGGIEFIQSHPLTSKRIEAAKERAQQVKAGTYKAP
jgi:beta-barrel assembly-enhancing protease